MIIGYLEEQLQHAFLRVVEIEHAREEERPHLADRRTNGMTRFAEDVPERDGISGERVVRDAKRLETLGDFRCGATCLGDAAQVALDIGEKYRYAERAETFREGLQRDSLARAGRAGNEAVPIAHLGREEKFGGAFGEEERFRHEGSLAIG